MQLKINGQLYSVSEEKSGLTESISRLSPCSLVLSRSAGHEYYGTLQEPADVTGARKTSFAEAGGIYYFQAWNAFSLNFKDMDIEPYQVHVIGKADASLAEVLASCGKSVEVDILR